MKICTKCKRELDETCFYKNRNGLGTRCRECHAEYGKQYQKTHREGILERYKRYYEEHKGKMLEQANQYYETHKEEIKRYRETHKEEHAEWMKRYYRAHKKKIAEYDKRRNEIHAEEFAKRKKRYQEAHKEEIKKKRMVYDKTPYGMTYHKNASSRRRAVLRSLPATLTIDQWLEILTAHSFLCAYNRNHRLVNCSQAEIDALHLPALLATQDHVIPITKGGPHAAENVVPACKSCNGSKGVKAILPIAFIRAPANQMRLFARI